LFNDKGERLASESAQYKLITKGEFIEFDANEFFNIFSEVVGRITCKFKVDALSVDTQGETLIVLDKDGKPLMNAIIWLDNRAEKQAKEMEKAFGLKNMYDLTGQTEIPAGYPAPKIKWLKENAPEVFNNADKFLLLEDYIIYRMTGKFASSRSLYSSSLLMNVHTGEYIPEVLEFLGISENQLPKLKESGEIVGEYNGIKVTTSALDQIAGITGAGVVKEGLMSETTGTALAVCALTEKFPPYFDGLKVSAYYVRKGLYCLLMWAPTAGAALEWFKGNFSENVNLKELDEMAEQVQAGCEGLKVLPHLCGTVMPEYKPNAKGVFFGVELKHTRAHFARAIMESVAYMIKEYVDFMQVEVNEIRSMGGGAKSKLWCGIKSGVLNKNIVTLNENETACLGSAIFAGVGTGVFNDSITAVNKIVSVKNVYEPKEQGYQELYTEYKQIEKKLMNIF
jgi:xylulokinase